VPRKAGAEAAIGERLARWQELRAGHSAPGQKITKK
jgi:hypothetical protein